METNIVIFDNQQYEVPTPVAKRMGEYYDAMTKLNARVTTLTTAITDLADKELIAHERPIKENRLSAWYAKKDLFKLVDRFIIGGGGYLKRNRNNVSK